jgi:uncharacterized protein YggE
MRSVVGSILVVLVLAGVDSFSLAQCNTCPERRQISVNGTGKVTADADLAIVRVGYKLYGADAKSVYANATETSNAIMKALTASGIPKSAIESTSQVLQHTPPNEIQWYPPNTDEWRNHQFTATQSWIIRVKPDDAAGTLNTAINAGANESGWIEWIVQNPSTLRAEASAKAVAGARMLAEQIAQRSNVQLGPLVSVMENQWPWGNSGGGVIAGIAGGTGIVDRVQFGNQQLAINSRRVEFSVSVSVVFAIE